jgi:hypothetical protein
MVTGREDFVGLVQFGRTDGALAHLDAGPRSSPITRCRVMPLRNVPFGTGVCTTPSFTIITFCAVSSATLPIGSHITALSKPRRFASAMARPAIG